MFTGIIEEIGTIKRIASGSKSAVLTIEAHDILSDVKVGDSVAVNGVCLTATSVSASLFTADVMAETLRRSSLGSLRAGSRVNLERAMAAGGRFGGHIVSGHIDGTGEILDMTREDNAVWVTVKAPDSILRLIVEKGSIAIDGISLTVAYVDSVLFKVSIIPHTASETTLLSKKRGDVVNLENDIIGKYVEKLMGLSGNNGGSVKSDSGNLNRGARDGDSKKQGFDMNLLIENGFV